MHEQVHLIFNQKFSSIKSVTYSTFSRLVYFLLTLSTDELPKPAGKTDTPFPLPPALLVDPYHTIFSQLFERTN
jgi:hypothetical protein